VRAGRVRLHRVDNPLSLDIVSELLDRRRRPADGYERTYRGACVDRDALCRSSLSNSEQAVIRIARGCSNAERRGGLPPATVLPEVTNDGATDGRSSR
jgi:hypothetical protein